MLSQNNKKYRFMNIDGSFSKFGGSVVCLTYCSGPHKIIRLSPQNDPFETEYCALIEALKELDDNLVGSERVYPINIKTDCQVLFEEIQGIKSTSRPELYNTAKEIMGRLHIIFRWSPRHLNRAGKILEHRINVMKKNRKLARINNI